MELRDLAEQILFATTLEEKLQCPAMITDEQPGLPRLAPAAPGRPPELLFKTPGSGGAEFPGARQLEKERERGSLLHFFANHELLATELMALVLLRFPEAPAAFRRGVLQTLQDEQEHTRLYLRRMSECGVRFGELPVSGYFWRAVSGMESPMDYVAGLSLTFEQANLDFARHFSQGFAQVGDEATAQLLDRIYRDEIAHVAHGLKWFRRWKNPCESDWSAFCHQLKFPLSPQRAKGFALNIEGRCMAGFDAEFIAELSVFAHSKGRTPTVFVFNPCAEGFIAQGRSFTPVKHQIQLARDLENLPQFLCRQDDVVLVEQRPSSAFLNGLQQAGFPLPEFVTFDPRPAATAQSDNLTPMPFTRLRQRKLAGLRPWAWAPDSVEMLAPLFSNVTGETRTTSERFNDGMASLYSKAWSAAFLRKVLQQHAKSADESATWLCSEEEVGVAVDSLDEALQTIAAIRRRGHHRIVVKEAVGLAGHNAIRLWEPELLESHRRWMARALENGRPLIIEPWLEREQDFSVQLEMTRDGLKVCGYTGLINDRKGQFCANRAAPDHARRIPKSITDLFRGSCDISQHLPHLYAAIFETLQTELRRVAYLGPLGIDAFAYRTASDEVRLKPIVEINPRYTMGRLTVELMKRTASGSHGLFRLASRAMVQAEGFSDFPAYAHFLNEQFPLQLAGEPVPKIREGAVCLNDPATARVCLAIFQVSRRSLEQ